jgi:hypothetical protein
MLNGCCSTQKKTQPERRDLLAKRRAGCLWQYHTPNRRLVGSTALRTSPICADTVAWSVPACTERASNMLSCCLTCTIDLHMLCTHTCPQLGLLSPRLYVQDSQSLFVKDIPMAVLQHPCTPATFDQITCPCLHSQNRVTQAAMHGRGALNPTHTWLYVQNPVRVAHSLTSRVLHPAGLYSITPGLYASSTCPADT